MIGKEKKKRKKKGAEKAEYKNTKHVPNFFFFHQSFKTCSILTPDIRKQPQTSLGSI